MYRKILFSLLLIAGVFSPGANGLEIMQPLVYKETADISGWLMSEKLDGVRGYWNGKKLLSKNGSPFNPHPSFLKNFPDFPVEGEIWGGRGSFEKTIGAIKKKAPHKGWLELKFGIFDVPEAEGGFEKRLKIATKWFKRNPSKYAFIIEHNPVKGEKHLRTVLQRIEAAGGEGIILRKPGSLYTSGRSEDILKVKNYYDTEAVVIDHIEGKGKNTGKMGSLLVELQGNKTRFRIGTGFSDEDRETPPPIGTVITFKYYGFYKSGIPKFPSFLRIRNDILRDDFVE